jgi:hypothetical protein
VQGTLCRTALAEQAKRRALSAWAEDIGVCHIVGHRIVK